MPLADAPAASPQGGDIPAEPVATGETVYIPEVAESAYDTGWDGLSAPEQLLLELVNAARLDPAGEAVGQGVGLAIGVTATPKQALAVDTALSAASEAHSEDMEAQDYFSHTGLDGSTPTSRAASEGYSGGVGENLGWVGSTAASFDDAARIADHHAYLWGSPEHQENLLNGAWDVVGIGYADGDYLYKGVNYKSTTFVTQKFGSQPESHLTGVVIDDRDGDAFYDIGEGQGQVKVTAFNETGVYTTETYASGGYSLALNPGTYSVVFHGGTLDGVYETEVSIGAENVKLDVIEATDAVDADLVAAATVQDAIMGNETLSVAGSEDLYLGDLLEEAIHSATDAALQPAALVEPQGAAIPLSPIPGEPAMTFVLDSTEPYEDEETQEDMLQV